MHTANKIPHIRNKVSGMVQLACYNASTGEAGEPSQIQGQPGLFKIPAQKAKSNERKQSDGEKLK